MVSLGETQTFRTERLFRCPAQRLWQAWTDADLFSQWFNPYPAADAVVQHWDLRVGGQVRFDLVSSDGKRAAQEGKIYVLEPLREIVQGTGDMRIRARFEPVGEDTRMRLEQTGLPMQVTIEEVHQGWDRMLDKLQRLVED